MSKNISVTEAVAIAIDIDDKNLWVSLADGRQLGVPLVYFPRLLNASKSERLKYSLSGGGRGIHWESIDEDISVNGLLFGFGDQTKLGKTLY